MGPPETSSFSQLLTFEVKISPEGAMNYPNILSHQSPTSQEFNILVEEPRLEPPNPILILSSFQLPQSLQVVKTSCGGPGTSKTNPSSSLSISPKHTDALGGHLRIPNSNFPSRIYNLNPQWVPTHKECWSMTCDWKVFSVSFRRVP